MLIEECEDRQRNELQALSSIFLEDFVLDSVVQKRVWNKAKQPAFTIKVRLQDLSSSPLLTNDVLPSIVLRVEFTTLYPTTLPKLSLSDPRNLSEVELLNLEAILKNTANGLVGMEMIYDLTDAVRAHLRKCIKPGGISSLDDERIKRLKEIEIQTSIEEKLQSVENLKSALVEQDKFRNQIKVELQAKVRSRKLSNTMADAQVLQLPVIEFVEFNKPLRIGQFVVSSLPLSSLVIPHDESCTRPYLSHLDVAGTIIIKEHLIRVDNQNVLQEVEALVAKFCLVKEQHPDTFGLDVHGSSVVSHELGYRFFVAQQYATRRSVKDLLASIRTIAEEDAKAWLIHLANELVVAHRAGIYHKRISLSKVMLVERGNRTVATLCDWGFSYILSRHNLVSDRSDINAGNNETSYRPADDILAICQVFLEMISGLGALVLNPLEHALEIHRDRFSVEIRHFLSSVINGAKHLRYTASDFLSSEYLRSTGTIIQRAPALLAPFFPQGTSQSRYLTDFEELSHIGRGAYGTVVRARNRLDGRVYAVKSIQTRTEARVLREVSGLARLNHPSIVRYFASWVEKSINQSAAFSSTSSSTSSLSQDQTENDDILTSSVIFANSRSPSDVQTTPDQLNFPHDSTDSFVRTLFIQMEYCSGDTLRSLIESRKVGASLWNYFSQIVDGVKYIHSQGLIHRDLKPANIFVSPEGQLKLGDFGLAMEFTASAEAYVLDTPNHTSHMDDTGEVGTYLYQAPELITSKRYDSKVDLYALGIILGELSCSWSTGMERILILKGLRMPKIVCPLPEERQREIGLLGALLSHDPSERPSADVLSTMLPPVVHKSHLKDTLKLVNEDRTFKEDVLSHFFSSQPLSTEYVYDADSHGPLHANTTLCRESLVQSVHRVFRVHGAMDRSMSMAALFPYNAVYEAKANVVKLLDESSNVLQLPYDFKVSYARHLARQSVNREQEKSFVIGPVFRSDCRSSKTYLEADFDVICGGTFIPVAVDVEPLRVLFEIIWDIPQINLDFVHCTLGHSAITKAILEQAHVPSAKSVEAVSMLATLSQKHDRQLSSTWQKSLAKILNESCVLELLRFIPRSEAGFQSEIRRILGLLCCAKSPWLREVEEEIQEFILNIGKFGISVPIHFQPFTLASHTFDLTYTMEYGTGPRDVLAVGGIYDTLLEAQQIPGQANGKVHASGFSMAFDKLLKLQSNAPECLNHMRHVDVVINASAHEKQATELVTRLWSNSISSELCFVEEAMQFCLSRNAAILLSFKDKRLTSHSQPIIKVKRLDMDVTEEVLLDTIVTYLHAELTDLSHKARPPPLLRDPSSASTRSPEVMIIGSDDKRLRASQHDIVVSKAIGQFSELTKDLQETKIPLLILDLGVDDMNVLKSINIRGYDEQAFRRLQDQLTGLSGRNTLMLLRKTLSRFRVEGKRYSFICSMKCQISFLLNI